MDVKFKMGDGTPFIYDAGSIIIDKQGKKLYVDTTSNETGRIQIGGSVKVAYSMDGGVPFDHRIEEVVAIPMSITKNGITSEYYLLAIEKPTEE